MRHFSHSHICSCCPSLPFCASWNPGYSQRNHDASRWQFAGCQMGKWSCSKERKNKLTHLHSQTECKANFICYLSLDNMPSDNRIHLKQISTQLQTALTGTLQLCVHWKKSKMEKRKGKIGKQVVHITPKPHTLKSQKRPIHSHWPPTKPKTGLTQCTETSQAVSNNLR